MINHDYMFMFVFEITVVGMADLVDKPPKWQRTCKIYLRTLLTLISILLLMSCMGFLSGPRGPSIASTCRTGRHLLYSLLL